MAHLAVFKLCPQQMRSVIRGFILGQLLLLAGWLPITVWAADSVSESAVISFAGPRTVLDFDGDWRFTKGDFESAMVPGFDDSGWRLLDVPHDWSIEGPFGPDYASGTGYAPGGIGWYRKSFSVDGSVKGKLVAVEFDGVYNHAEVWINGHFVGGRPYGYSSFECDVTPHLKYGPNAVNVLAVRVDHSKFADSRWYTGSGIYRNVRLRVNNKVRIAPWGTSVTTPVVKADSARVNVETEVANDSTADVSDVLHLEILGPDGQVVAAKDASVRIKHGAKQTVIAELDLKKPQLWSVYNPRLYTLRSRLRTEDLVLDETSTSFGVRTIKFDPDKGFFLNGVAMKIKGVCIHHDAGALGAAVPEAVLERRLVILKGMGVNAIRTSHNPPAPELLDLCDRLGLLVKDEAFDEFTPAKNKWVTGRNNGQPSRYGYAEDFEEWSQRDIQDMVRRDRNHPSIIMWSIGNEIDYANDPFSDPVLGDEYHPENPAAQNLVKHGQPLVAAVKQLDTTRPVTAALATVAMSDAVGFGNILDIVGYNYQEGRYPADHAKYPKRVIYGSETSQMLGAWQAVATNDYVCGQFLWTGIDYLGEAGAWPNHASSAGLLDMCGFKKPLAWFRQSLWSDQPMVYLCVSPRFTPGSFGGNGRRGFRMNESWNWASNSTVVVRCYTTCPEVELELNGHAIGTKKLSEAVQGALTWEVPFTPGTLTATGHYGTNSTCVFTLKTAGAAKHIELLPDTTQLAANGKGVCQVEYRITDDVGVRLPEAGDEVTFSVTGPAKILGIENGNPNSTEPQQGQVHRAFQGHGILYLETTHEAGAITLKAEAEGLEAGSLSLTSH